MRRGVGSRETLHLHRPFPMGASAVGPSRICPLYHDCVACARMISFACRRFSRHLVGLQRVCAPSKARVQTMQARLMLVLDS